MQTLKPNSKSPAVSLFQSGSQCIRVSVNSNTTFDILMHYTVSQMLTLSYLFLLVYLGVGNMSCLFLVHRCLKIGQHRKHTHHIGGCRVNSTDLKGVLVFLSVVSFDFSASAMAEQGKRQVVFRRETLPLMRAGYCYASTGLPSSSVTATAGTLLYTKIKDDDSSQAMVK